MKFLVKTQIFAVLLVIFWVIYLNVLAFFDQPGRALQYINWFVYGLAIVLAIFYFLMTKVFIGRNWMAVPLIVIPYFLLYKPLAQQMLLSVTNARYGMTLKFFALSTGTTYLLAIIFGLGLGILFTRPQFKR